LKARVTDKSSLPASPYVNLTPPVASEFDQAPALLSLRPSPGARTPAGWVVCQICGRRGRWINPFPEVQHDFR
jgi:hypothetical protein